MIFATTNDRSTDLTWIDLDTNQRGTVPRDPDTRARINYVRERGGIKGVLIPHGIASDRHSARWLLTKDPERRMPGAFCVREISTGAAKQCFVLPVVEDLGAVIELDDGTVVIASWPGPRYPVWRIDPTSGAVIDLGVVHGPPLATARWLAWTESSNTAATLFVRPLDDERAAVRAIDLGRADIDECRLIPARPEAAVCRMYASKGQRGRGLYFVDLAAGTKRAIGVATGPNMAVSPDGHWLAYAVANASPDDENEPAQRVIMTPLAGGEARQITQRAEIGQQVIAWIP
ncbi:MAG: hypothetical protein H0T46_07860 [Deltaproteobacteria bacterium]|nr:hypothetical protein [Deltaproteobacteria bacterium]